MARPEEKARALLNRHLAARRAEREREREGEFPSRRPHLARECTNLSQAQRWRAQIVGEIAAKVAQIQDASIGEHAVRDLNDHINKLLREKHHWELQVLKLGGPNYLAQKRRRSRRGDDDAGAGKAKAGKRSVSDVRDSDGSRPIEADGYFYFGAARDLPGVRELFEERQQEEAAGAKRKLERAELYKRVNARYYGFAGQGDGDGLDRLEAKAERRLWKRRCVESGIDVKGKKVRFTPLLAAEEETTTAAVPTQDDIEAAVLEAKKKALLEKYGVSQAGAAAAAAGT